MTTPQSNSIERASKPFRKRNQRVTRGELLLALTIVLAFAGYVMKHNSDGRKARNLLLAVQRNDILRTSELLAQGADVNGQFGQNEGSGSGSSFWGGGSNAPIPPLSQAIIRGNGPMRSLLLEHGANVNQWDSENKTPLMYAAGGGQTDLCLDLVKRGARMSDKDFQYRDALAWAAMEGKMDTAKALLNQITNAKDRKQSLDVALRECAATGKVKMAATLLILGADPEAQNDRNGGGYSQSTCIYDAANNDQFEVAELLLAHGANPNKPGNGNLPLAVARTAKMVDLLLKYGANMNQKDASGYTPVAWALMGNNEAMARHMLVRGADPNSTDAQGSSLLILAVQSQRNLVIDRLLKYGANVNYANKQGLTALKMAGSNTTIAAMLVKAGAK